VSLPTLPIIIFDIHYGHARDKTERQKTGVRNTTDILSFIDVIDLNVYSVYYFNEINAFLNVDYFSQLLLLYIL
jgi:hypothetical protein